MAAQQWELAWLRLMVSLTAGLRSGVASLADQTLAAKAAAMVAVIEEAMAMAVVVAVVVAGLAHLHADPAGFFPPYRAPRHSPSPWGFDHQHVCLGVPPHPDPELARD